MREDTKTVFSAMLDKAEVKLPDSLSSVSSAFSVSSSSSSASDLDEAEEDDVNGRDEAVFSAFVSDFSIECRRDVEVMVTHLEAGDRSLRSSLSAPVFSLITSPFGNWQGCAAKVETDSLALGFLQRFNSHFSASIFLSLKSFFHALL